MSIRPPLLRKGDKIGLVAPSRMITREQMVKAYLVFESWGLQVVDGKSLYNKHGYFAGQDKERLNDLQEFIDDDEIKAIFCARGGYGMTRIVDQLDLSHLQKRPKWVVGFSDVTSLHFALHRSGIESIHGLMPVQFGYTGAEKSVESLRGLLFEEKQHYIEAVQTKFSRAGRAFAPLVGGNLSLVAESLGTQTEIDTRNKILFLEEIDEYLYKIDRMLTQLGRAGKLSKLAGLIIGDFSGMKDTEIAYGQDIAALISQHVQNYDYPVAFNFPIGHENLNMAVPVSRDVKFEVKRKKADLTF